MKTAIFYFSGTGNTERVVNAWLNALSSEGITAEAFKIEDKTEVDFSSYDKIGLAYPIHAFNAPEILLDFVKKLPVFSQPKPFYIIMVSGEALRLNDSSDRKIESILKGKNAFVESRRHYLMPYNMIFRHTEKRAYKMADAMQKLVPIDVKEYFIEGKANKPAVIKGTGFLTFAFRIEQWFAHVNGRLYRVTKDCVHCMRCVDTCPVKNIVYEKGKLKFKNKCILCTRCSFNCPKDAIRIGILDFWRVNGPYRFRRPETEEKDKHKRYCRRSYKRYFDEAERRINTEGKALDEETVKGNHKNK